MVYMVEFYSEKNKTMKRYELEVQTFYGLVKEIYKLRRDDDVVVSIIRKDYDSIKKNVSKIFIDIDLDTSTWFFMHSDDSAKKED